MREGGPQISWGELGLRERDTVHEASTSNLRAKSLTATLQSRLGGLTDEFEVHPGGSPDLHALPRVLEAGGSEGRAAEWAESP